MLSLIIAVLVVVCDYVSKYLVITKLKPLGNVKIINGILDFTYVENRGAAFGIFGNHRWVFMVLTCVVLLVILFVIYKYRGKSRLLDVTLGLFLGGGIGNMIDRVRLGYVVDFIDFCAFDFWKWVFNIADCAVTIGAVLFIIYLLFFDKVFGVRENKNGEKHE